MSRKQTNYSNNNNQDNRNTNESYPDRVNDNWNANSSFLANQPIVLRRNDPAEIRKQTEMIDSSNRRLTEDDKNATIIQSTPDKASSRKYSRDSGCESTSNEESNACNSKIDNSNGKYKTELCKFYEINGKCKFGEKVIIFIY